jgi:DNA polymerase-4
MIRNILHLRIEAFHVVVERLKDSSLTGKPVAVCPRHSPRSLILSASPEARQEGVSEGLTLTRALQRCRNLIVIPPNEPLYRKANEEIIHVLERYSPLVEPGYPGRFYVDMTGTSRLFGAFRNSASHIRREVYESANMEGTLGIGSSKLVSGVAAKVVSSYGDFYAVPPGSEASFLAPLRVGILPSVRSRTERELLDEFNIRLVRQLAGIAQGQLIAVFGKFGVLLHQQAMGIDETPVRPPCAKPFVLEERTLDEDTNDDGILEGILYGMVEKTCRRMRTKKVLPGTVWFHLRYADGVDITRCFRLRRPTTTDPLLFRTLEPLFLKTNERRQRVRYLSITFTDLVFPPAQLSLFKMPLASVKEESLAVALDKIRSKYGDEAIQWARIPN